MGESANELPTMLWQAHEHRLARLEEGFGEMRQTVSKIETEIARNNEMTRQIGVDTKDIRDMVAGARVFSRFIMWAGGLSTAAGGLALVISWVK